MRIFICLLLSGVVASSVSAQSLAEMAKKEKERRRALDGDLAPVRAYSDDDLDGAGRDDSEPAETVPAPEGDDDRDEARRRWLSEKDTEHAAWRERLARHQERYTEQKALLAQLEPIRAQCADNGMPIASTEHFVENGSSVTWGVGHVTCDALPAREAELEQAMRDIELECREDARRHSIPPAEAMLR